MLRGFVEVILGVILLANRKEASVFFGSRRSIVDLLLDLRSICVINSVLLLGLLIKLSSLSRHVASTWLPSAIVSLLAILHWLVVFWPLLRCEGSEVVCLLLLG